jgi:hypothetical protein
MSFDEDVAERDRDVLRGDEEAMSPSPPATPLMIPRWLGIGTGRIASVAPAASA